MSPATVRIPHTCRTTLSSRSRGTIPLWLCALLLFISINYLHYSSIINWSITCSHHIHSIHDFPRVENSSWAHWGGVSFLTYSTLPRQKRKATPKKSTPFTTGGRWSPLQCAKSGKIRPRRSVLWRKKWHKR